MATLEVHDGQGRVERVVIAHDQQAMIGSSPKCEIVLAGDRIFPFHGRLRWQPKKKCFKIDASPDAQFLLVNGHKMASSSLHQGDEIEVGPYRIFLINDADQDPPPPPARDDVTRIQPPSFIAPQLQKPGAVFIRSAWRKTQEFDAPSVEIAVAAPDFPSQAPPSPRDLKKPPSASPPERGWKRLLYLFSPRAKAPGQEEVFSSPLVFSLGAALVALVLVGFALYGIIIRTTATRAFTDAIHHLEDGDYRNAIRKFDLFLASNPLDPRAGKAKVHRAIANIRQYVTATGSSWSLALEAEQAMFDNVGGLDEYRDSSTELDELVIRTGESLADRARLTSDSKILAEAESSLSLHTKVAGKSADALLKKSRLPEKLLSARAAVRKAKIRRDSLAAMDAALKSGSSARVYSARDSLVAQYVDQSEDRDLLAHMKQANDLIRKAVKLDPSTRPAETEPRIEPLGPPTSLVARAPDFPPSAPDSPLVFALAEGFAYAVEGASGAPVWQIPLGLSSPFPPQPIPGGTSLLAIDARHDELLRLDAKTGRLLWRQSLGEPVSDPPLVLGNQIIQAIPSGKLLLIDLLTGALRTAIDLGMPLSRTPVSDESGQNLYVAAEKDCLFVLTRDPLACASVEYLGHAPGSIACPPARLGRYLIVPENHLLNESRWRIFLLDEGGLNLAPVQQLPVNGWTWSTPASSGSVVWSTGDRGGVSAYAVGAYGSKDPLRPIAKIAPDANPSGPAFALARSERELWVGSGRSGRYELLADGGKLNASWTLAEAGPALAPPQTAGPLLVLTQQYTEGPGVALWGIDPPTGGVRWRTVLGTPWPSPPTPEADHFATLGLDGKPLSISRDLLHKGGFVTTTFPKPGNLSLTPGSTRLDSKGWTVVVPPLGASTLLVRSDDNPFKRITLPAPLGAIPLPWGRELLIPGADGRVYLIDPRSGESRAEPYIPPFDRNRPTRWRAPVLLADDAVALADEAGRVRKLNRVNTPTPRLVVAAETVLGKDVVADPASTGTAVVLVTADNRARALSARDLSPAGAWPLDAPLALPPTTIAGRCYLADSAGNILALAPDGQRLWSVRLPHQSAPAVIVGPPSVRNGSIVFLTSDGTLHARSLTDGAATETIPLHLLPAGKLVSSGPDLAISVALGTLRLLSQEPERNP